MCALFILFCIFLLLFFFWLFVVSFSFGFLGFFLIFGFCIWLFSMFFFFLRDRERNNIKLDKSGDEKDLRGLGDRKYDQNILYGKYNIFK